MKHENETTAETTASRVKQTLNNAANEHPRAKYASRFYSAEVRDGHRPGAVVVNLLCFYEREIARLTGELKKAVGKAATVAPMIESMDGETGDWLVTFAA